MNYTLEQATKLVCKVGFSFKINGVGHAISFKEGSIGWITNSQVDQKSRQLYNIAKKNQKIGYDFTVGQLREFFHY